MIDIREQARGRWFGILTQCGIAPQFLTGRHHPCPLCGGKDRFRYDDQDGSGSYICNQCGAGYGIDLVMKKNGLDFKDAAAKVRGLIGSGIARTKPKPQNSAAWLVNQIWAETVPLAGTQADDYLRGRGINGWYYNNLRFHPNLPLSDVAGHKTAPAMVALVQDVNGKPCAVSRTYLDGANKASWRRFDGKQMASRQFLGDLPAGCAVRLYEPDTDVLGIAEGIETALRSEKRFSKPMWAVLNSGLMERFIVPQGVRRFHIMADNDRLYGGQKAAYALANKLALKNRNMQITVHIPDKVGTDWAD